MLYASCGHYDESIYFCKLFEVCDKSWCVPKGCILFPVDLLFFWFLVPIKEASIMKNGLDGFYCNDKKMGWA